MVDGLVQHYNALVYFGIWVRDIIKNLLSNHTLSVPLWDFNIGYGSDVITTLHYYVIGDPLDLLSIFVPSMYTEYLYNVLVVLRMYLAGASFSLFCFRMKKGRMAVLAGSIAYSFCGYMIFWALRHPFFVNSMIYLPLLLVGVENIYRKKKPALFIWMVFISAVSNFYFFYMLVFAVAFYVAARFFTLGRGYKWKDLVKYILYFSLYGLVGVLLSAFIMLPVFLLLTGGMRGDIDIFYPIFYSKEYYQRVLTDFFTARYLNGAVFGFAAPVLLGLFVLFSRKKERGVFKVSFFIMVVMLCIPELGRVMNGFSYVSNRWSFIFAALLCYILVDVWPDMMVLDNRQKKFIAVCSGLYLCIILAFSRHVSKSSLTGVIILLVSLAVILSEKKKRQGHFLTAPLLILGLIVIHVCAISYFRYGHDEGDRAASYVDRGKALSLIKGDATSLASKVSDKKPFGRVDMDKKYFRNASIITKVPTTQFFWSMENGNISRYLLDMCMGGMRSTFSYDGLEKRTALEALGSVRYHVRSSRDHGPVPYGFVKTGMDIQGIHKSEYEIFENRNALPLGYTYSSYLTHGEFDRIDPVKKQEALLQAVLLEDKDAKDLPDTIKKAPSLAFTSQDIPYEIKCGKSVVQEGTGDYLCLKRNARITLAFDNVKNCELYLLAAGIRARAKTRRGLDSIHNDRDHPKFTIKVQSGDGKGVIVYKTPSHRYYSGQNDYLVNLGYQDEARTKITIQFPAQGIYHIDDLKVICQPMDHYVAQVNMLKEDVLEDIEIGTDYLEGSIDLQKDKILCLTVPYCKGWRAYVDGEEKPLYQVNGMYMGLPLLAGKHKIVLHYVTYGLKSGICISGIGLILFLIICRRERKESRHPH